MLIFLKLKKTACHLGQEFRSAPIYPQPFSTSSSPLTLTPNPRLPLRWSLYKVPVHSVIDYKLAASPLIDHANNELRWDYDLGPVILVPKSAVNIFPSNKRQFHIHPTANLNTLPFPLLRQPGVLGETFHPHFTCHQHISSPISWPPPPWVTTYSE